MPAKLPAKLTPLWSHDLTAKGLGGVAATADIVIVSDRELGDTTDVWKCLAAATGKELWTVRYPAPGSLDYGNSPRATPVIRDGLVYLAGAFGHVLCVDLATGKTVWEVNTHDEFEPAEKPRWGTSSTPLLVDDKLIVNPGAKDASLAALDAKTGKTLWKAPGRPAGYGSFVLATFGGVRQVVGHDADSLGGWDAATGRRLWQLAPDRAGDFNVPTPIPVGDRLLVSTENNGTRLYAFDAAGKIVAKHVAVHKKLAPDTHTPVVVGDRVFGVWRRLYCLSADLKLLWDEADPAFNDYCAIVTDGTRLLIVSRESEFILLDAAARKFDPISRVKLFDDEKGLYSHPAFVGRRAYVRGGSAVVAVDLGT
ncbi:MAG TPA: PQQ-binding-like beta-propeller repeat protein [Gemmataceae bacterium]|nr:PQQ-binding-like beta-propeller repeat protein [Gemmataceae bacterium]